MSISYPGIQPTYNLQNIYILLIAFQSLIPFSFRSSPFHGLNVGQGRTRQKYNSIIFVRFDYEKIKLRKIADLTEFCQN